MPIPQKLFSPVNSFIAGRQARQQEDYGNTRNALAQQELQTAQTQNALLGDPNATPEQLARAGRPDIGNSVINSRKFDHESKLKAAQQLSVLAQRALKLPDAASRRAFTRQATTMYAPVFEALGVDLAKGMAERDAVPDEELERVLQQAAAQSNQSQMETFEGPDGSILQRDPDDGKVTSVLGREPKPLVNVALPEQKYEDAATKAAGEAAGKAFSDIKERGRLATEELDSLRALRASDASTGPGAEAIAFTTQLAKQLGIPVSDKALERAAAIGQYGAAANNLVLNRQLAQKGPQTESDAKRIRDTLAKSSNVAEVNRAILDYNIALKGREMEAADFAENYRLDTGKVDGWERAWRQYLRDTPIATNHAKTGALIFYHQFRDKIQEADPTMSEEQIRQEWRRVSSGR